MNVKYWIVFLLALTIAGCKYAEGLEEKEVPGRFKISVTDYLREANNLHPGAVFQYSSPYRTVYLLVLDTTKAGLSLAEYGQIASNRIAVALKDSTIDPIDSISISAVPTIGYKIEGIITNEGVWYYLAVVEGKEHYYQVLGWTLTRRKEKYSKDIEEMVKSFKLI
jgi:hypothetical protein